VGGCVGVGGGRRTAGGGKPGGVSVCWGGRELTSRVVTIYEEKNAHVYPPPEIWRGDFFRPPPSPRLVALSCRVGIYSADKLAVDNVAGQPVNFSTDNSTGNIVDENLNITIIYAR